MSEPLTCVVRHDGVDRVFSLPSAALAYLFDPRIYAGEKSAVASFVARQVTDGSARGVAPQGAGLLVLDIDGGVQWDLQFARQMPLLSVDADASWLHFEEWKKRNWLVPGLVDPKTHKVVAAFPAQMNLAWYADIKRAHLDRPEPDLYDFVTAPPGTADTLPRFAIAPAGWTFRSTRMPAHRMTALAEIEEAGFAIAMDDEVQWYRWNPDEAPEWLDAPASATPELTLAERTTFERIKFEPDPPLMSFDVDFT